VFESRVLRRIFRPNKRGITGKWKKLHAAAADDDDDVHIMHLLSNLIRMIKSKRNGWTVHVADKRGKRSAFRVLV
jgi:hypothetical protein